MQPHSSHTGSSTAGKPNHIYTVQPSFFLDWPPQRLVGPEELFFLGGIIEVMFIYPGSFWARANYVHLTALNNHKVTLQGPGTFERHPQDNLVR